ncbi:MAG TPA: hypothetical protein VFM27_03045 [Acidimicrobiales bacterium]|nr:hypothetical protein [Acidimicrobiales bacterium]
MIRPGAAQAGSAHLPEDPVDRGLIDVTDAATADLGCEPLQMESPTVIDRPLLAALHAQEVLGEELLDRIVDAGIPVLPGLGRCAASDVGHECLELPRCRCLGGRADRAVEPADGTVLSFPGDMRP